MQDYFEVCVKSSKDLFDLYYTYMINIKHKKNLLGFFDMNLNLNQFLSTWKSPKYIQTSTKVEAVRGHLIVKDGTFDLWFKDRMWL